VNTLLRRTLGFSPVVTVTKVSTRWRDGQAEWPELPGWIQHWQSRRQRYPVYQ